MFLYDCFHLCKLLWHCWWTVFSQVVDNKQRSLPFISSSYKTKCCPKNDIILNYGTCLELHTWHLYLSCMLTFTGFKRYISPHGTLNCLPKPGDKAITDFWDFSLKPVFSHLLGNTPGILLSAADRGKAEKRTRGKCRKLPLFHLHIHQKV